MEWWFGLGTIICAIGLVLMFADDEVVWRLGAVLVAMPMIVGLVWFGVFLMTGGHIR